MAGGQHLTIQGSTNTDKPTPQTDGSGRISATKVWDTKGPREQSQPDKR